LLLKRAQNLSIDSDIPLNEVLKMPFWFLDSFYKDGAWNIKKVHKENHDQIVGNVFQYLQNIQGLLKSVSISFSRKPR